MSKKEASDATAILTQDHQKILAYFDEFQRLQATAGSDDERQSLVERACLDLRIHTQAEEELFYPLLRDELDDVTLLDQAAVEHEVAAQLINDLTGMQASDEYYDAKFTVLGAYIRHHIDEEQEKIFPLARKSAMDLKAIGQDILHRKDDLRTELGAEKLAAGHPAARGSGENGSKRAGRHPG